MSWIKMTCKSVTFVTMLIVLGIYNPLKAQDRSVTQVRETGIWNGVYLKVRITDFIGYYGEHHYRTRNSEDNLWDFAGRTRQVYNRAGINLYFGDWLEVVVGPTLVFNFTPSPGNSDYETYTLEPRIWHQWLFKTPKIWRLKIYHQFRFEHRWKRDNDVGADFDYTDRYRYKLFAYLPINKPNIQKGTVYISPSAEIFMHTGKSIVNNPFEDFRTYNGIGYVLSNKITFFAGHMWTIGQRPSGFEYGSMHILRFNVFIGLDARPIDKRMPSINIGY